MQHLPSIKRLLLADFRPEMPLISASLETINSVLQAPFCFRDPEHAPVKRSYLPQLKSVRAGTANLQVSGIHSDGYPLMLWTHLVLLCFETSAVALALVVASSSLGCAESPHADHRPGLESHVLCSGICHIHLCIHAVPRDVQKLSVSP